MKNAYFAIWYGCNQKCKGCPCGKRTDKSKSLTLDDVKQAVDALVEESNEEISITISGGEPTLHPDFFDILEYIKSKDIFLTILSNGEKFSDAKFVEEFVNHINVFKTRVVTTIHSSDYLVHEDQNQSKGSFDRSINGLNNIFMKGIKVTVKHCITKVNYKDTKDFIISMNNKFHPSVNFEIWGIDYCGLDREEADKLYVNYKELQPYLEEALDEVINIIDYNGRMFDFYNLPLCWVDPYYWNLWSMIKKDKNYSAYVDPKGEMINVGDGSGCYAEKCKICEVNKYCQGTYKSAFDYFGEECVNEIKLVK